MKNKILNDERMIYFENCGLGVVVFILIEFMYGDGIKFCDVKEVFSYYFRVEFSVWYVVVSVLDVKMFFGLG